MRDGATIENVNPDMAKFDANTGASLSSAAKAITSSALTPIKPVVLPDAVPQTQATGLEATIESQNKTQKTESDRLRAERQASLDAQKGDLNATMQEILGTNSDIASAGSTIDRTKEDKARIEADRLTSEIEAEQLSNRRRIEALQKNNPQGLAAGGLEQEINRINRDSVSKQADLAILQNSALRNYDTAKAIADRQLELKLEPLKANLENLKFFYTENKADFNRADDRLYAEAIKKSDAELKKQETLETQIMNMKLTAAQNGAPASVLSALGKATTIDQAVQAIGSYASDPLDRAIKNAQLTKLGKEIKLLGEPTAAEKKATEAALKEAEAAIPEMNNKIAAISVLQKHPGLDSRVGPNASPFSKVSLGDAFGAGQEFSGGVHKLVGGLTLDNLIAAKARGATFGALSEGELRLLASSASAINDWENKDAKGNGLGTWNIDEASFKRELANIQELTAKAIRDAGGEVITSDENDILDAAFAPGNLDLNPATYFTNQ